MWLLVDDTRRDVNTMIYLTFTLITIYLFFLFRYNRFASNLVRVLFKIFQYYCCIESIIQVKSAIALIIICDIPIFYYSLYTSKVVGTQYQNLYFFCYYLLQTEFLFLSRYINPIMGKNLVVVQLKFENYVVHIL